MDHMTGKPYCIWSPPYRHNCGGIKVLYKLADLLKGKGYRATINEVPNEDFIAVYPEIVFGNPFNAKTVVRYILNKPGLIGGPTTFPKTDIIFTFLKKYYNAPVLYINTIEKELFNSDNLPEKKGECYFIGKGKGNRMEGKTEITYDWPPTRKELADLLRKSERLYTFDNHTAMIEEALLCGCEVTIFSNEINLWPYHLGEYTNRQLDNFIKSTNLT